MLAPRALPLLLAFAAPGAAIGAELAPETVAAYERYIDRLEREFARDVQDGTLWLDTTAPRTRVRLREGEVLKWAGSGDGILDVPGGLIHHWRGAAFVRGATLDAVVAAAQDYASYHRVYEWVTRASLLHHVNQADPRRDRFWVLLRVQRSAGPVTSTLDVWSAVEYRYPRSGLATAASNADCIRQIDDAGEPGERRLPVGRGKGYLWRANTYAFYLERDGGVYIDFQTVGLSRGFPPLLGWIIEPIARRVGRSSAADSLEQLRTAAGSAAAAAPRHTSPDAPGPPAEWCGEKGAPVWGAVRPVAPKPGRGTRHLSTAFAAPALAQHRPEAETVDEAPAARAGSELDRFMARVLDNRHAAWRRLEDFILRETSVFELEGNSGNPLFGFRREYEWIVRGEVAVRSPVRFDGVEIGDGRRRAYEEAWLRDEVRPREDDSPAGPRFIVDAFYTPFDFEPGSYYFAGRETVSGREVVRIEYYPTEDFDHAKDERINRGFDKTSVVTFWIDPEVHQIVKHTLDTPGLDFLPFRWLARVDDLEMSAEMAPIGGVWLPARITLAGRVTTARGELRATLTREFFEYREAETGAALVDPGSPP